MSQEINNTQEISSSKRNRRTKRIAAQRNKPTLVTGNGKQISTVATEPEEQVEQIAAAETSPVSTEKATPPRRGFFSVIGKRSHDGEDKGVDVAQARLARAARNKDNQATSTDVKEGQEAKKPARTASRTPQRPASSFKFKYILGMLIYLAAANILGQYEIQFVRNSGMEKVLTTLTLFGGKLPISTSTIVYLATLIIILVLLAQLDLIPRSLSAASPQAQRTKQSATPQHSEPTPKFTPPPVRQGVSGDSDDLYRQYRNKLRREKKK